MVQVIQEIPKPLSGMQRFAAGLGEGISQGISDYTRMTIADKMDALKQQRQLQMAQQAQETMASKMQALGMPMAAQLTRAGLSADHLQKLAVESPDLARELMGGLGMQRPAAQETPFSPMDALRDQQQAISARNAILQPQDREAMPTEPEMVQQPTRPVSEPRTLDDFKRKIAPNYDQLMKTQREQVDRQAEREFNAAATIRKEKREIDTLKGKRFEKPISNILTHADEAEKLIPNFEVAIAQNEKMKTSPATWDAMVTSMSDQYPWLSNFKSSNAQILEAQTPAFIADFKGKMGGVLTNAKINLISKKVAGVGKNKDANRLILHLGYLDKKLDIARAEKANEIIRENNDIVPSDFDVKLKAAMYPIQKEISNDISLLLAGKRPSSEISRSSLGESKKETVKTLSNEGYSEGDTAYNTKTGKRYTYTGGKWVMDK